MSLYIKIKEKKLGEIKINEPSKFMKLIIDE